MPARLEDFDEEEHHQQHHHHHDVTDHEITNHLTTGRETKPSEYTMAIIKSHPRSLMMYWLSCLIKFALAMVVFAVAINTFIALADVDELEKYDASLSKKLSTFMIIVSVINLLTGVFMLVGSVV